MYNNPMTGLTGQGPQIQQGPKNNFAMGQGASDPGFQYNLPTQQAWSGHQNMMADRAQGQANAISAGGRNSADAAMLNNWANQTRQLGARQLPTQEQAYQAYQNRPSSPTFNMPYASRQNPNIVSMGMGGSVPGMQQGQQQGYGNPQAQQRVFQQATPMQLPQQGMQQFPPQLLALFQQYMQQQRPQTPQGVNLQGLHNPYQGF
jgi:hypothetical protein